MNSTTYEEFQNLLIGLNQERNDIQKQIDDNTWQIVEARSYAKEIMDREEEDFKVFSPRKIEDIYKDELHEYNVKQEDYENRNKVLIVKKEKLDSIVLVLEKVWEELSEKESSNEKESVNDKEEFLEDEIVESEMCQDEIEQEAEFSDEVENVDAVENFKKEDVVATVNETSKKLCSLIHKIDLGIKFIRQDPMRAKQELENVNKGITKIIDTLTEISNK